MFKRLVFVFALAPIAACGGSSSSSASSADTTPKTSEVSQPGPVVPTTVLELGEITVLQGTDAVLKIHANGSSELGGQSNGQLTYQTGPTIHTDGTFSSPSGKMGVKLNADGTMTDLTASKPLPLTVTADAVTIKADGQTAQITLAADGTLVVPGATGSAVKVQGADTAGKRKLALALIGLILIPPPQPTATPATATPATATPATATPAAPAPAAPAATPPAKTTAPAKK